jgi:N-acetylglutamate synthase-like GNAT family acetyltransferase
MTARDPETAGIRLATLDDADEIGRLIELSVLGLQAGDYSPEQMAGALGSVFGVDRQLIRDGSYFVVEREGRIIGCGGWSRRQTLFGGDAIAGKNDDELRPGVDAARIRAFFVHPDFARQGIGSQIMRASEEAAQAHGFTDLTLVATLTGEHLYLRHGFEAVRRYATPLSNGGELPMIEMRKYLGVQPGG